MAKTHSKHEEHRLDDDGAPPPLAPAPITDLSTLTGSQGIAFKPLPEWERPANPGKRFTVKTPNRGFNESRSYVRIERPHGPTGPEVEHREELKFVEGVAYTDDEAAAKQMRENGYEVEDGQRSEK